MLINPQQNTPTLSVDQLQAQLKNQVTSSMTGAFLSLKTTWTEMFNLIWTNPNLTPQQALDAFGTEAAELFTLAATFQNALNTAVPNALALTPPVPITFNPDGTVIINETQ